MIFEVITAPHINVNDLEMMVSKWHIKPWQPVKKGGMICEVETTKSIFEIESDKEGYIYPLVEEYRYVKVGEPLAYVFPKSDPKQLESITSKTSEEDKATVTKKARTLMQEHGLSVSDFPKFSVISLETVVAKIRSTNFKEDSYDQKQTEEVLKNINIDENSLVIYGEKNQSLLALDIFEAEGSFKPIAYISSSYKSDIFCSLPVIHHQALSLLKDKGLKYIYLCSQSTKIKEKQVQELEAMGFAIVSVRHPSAVVSSRAKIGKGVFVGAQVIVGPDVVVSDYCQILNGATIAHHCKLGKYVVVSDGAHLGGNVEVGDNSLIGIGVNVNKRVIVGKNSVIVSGATIVDFVPNNSVVRLNGEMRTEKDSKDK